MLQDQLDLSVAPISATDRGLKLLDVSDLHFQWLLRSRVGLCAGFRRRAGDSDFGDGSSEEINFHGQAPDPAATGARSGIEREPTVRKFATMGLLAALSFPATAVAAGRANDTSKLTRAVPQPQQNSAPDNDQTLRALHDEMERSRARALDSRRGKAFFHRVSLAGP